jgi:hypothetical protein
MNQSIIMRIILLSIFDFNNDPRKSISIDSQDHERIESGYNIPYKDRFIIFIH